MGTWHQSFVTLSCRISSFSNLYFRTKLQRKKNLWRVLLFHGTHAPISLLLLSLSVQQLHPHWGSALWEKTKWETFCCIKLSLSVIMLHVNVPNLSTSIIVYLSAWPFCQRMWHLTKTLHSCWKSFVEVTCSYFSFFFFFFKCGNLHLTSANWGTFPQEQFCFVFVFLNIHLEKTL